MFFGRKTAVEKQFVVDNIFPKYFTCLVEPVISLFSISNMLKIKTPIDIVLQDVTMKVISFSQQGPRAICILSANGIISNVTLRQPDSSGGTLTYEVCACRSHFKIYLFFLKFHYECMDLAYWHN